VPELRAHVLDRAGLLPAPTARELERTLVDFEAKTGHQIVVHTTPSLEGLEIEDYSIQLADAWKVGQKGLDNGVILTIAPVERRARIEVGYGLEGILPDVLASRIVNEVITPEFRAGRMAEGIRAGTLAIVDVVSGEVLPLPQSDGRGGVRSSWVVIFWIAVVLLILLSRGFFFTPPFGGSGMGRSRGWGDGVGRGGFGRGGFGGGGGFGAGGGFGGGGGGFGGGGASGSW
jgi:uncharacterized protein